MVGCAGRESAQENAMNNLRRAALVLILVSLVSCAKKEAASSTTASATTESVAVATQPATTTVATTATNAGTAPLAAAPAEAGIATADGETAGVTATVKELKRSSGGIVSLKFVIANGTDQRVDVGYTYGDPAHEIPDFASVGGVQLIDPVGKKKYFVARDSDGKCICSRGVKDIAAGTSVNVWAKFPAPPEDVKKIGIVIPHFSPLDDVPISD
jgi:hypothetical protein